MSELKKIEAPVLSPGYGTDVDETFNNIQENFDVLANQELYRGESGTNLITVNLSWQTIFDTPAGTPIPVIVGGVEPKTYYIHNFGPLIKNSLNELNQDNEEDTAAAIDGLKNSGNITVCFADVETTIDTPTQVLSAIPFVFIDMRFRSTADYSELSGRTDMSCVIMYAEGWECVQSFPSLYYNEGNLYWKINGQNTSILAQGPAGKDGSTGTVYVGLSNDLKINDVTTGSSAVQINIKYLLQYQIISSSSSEYEDLEEDSQSHLPFVTIADWIKINNSNPINGAPVIVMGEDQAPVTYNNNLGVPYYISELIYNESDNTCTCNVSKYNICYAHMNDNTVKRAIMNNVLTLPQSMPSGLGQDELPGYSIKERAEQTSGYSIFAPYGATYKELIISYVSDINNPSPGYNSIKSKFRIVGSLAEGSSTKAYGDYSHAEGYRTDAVGDYSHAEGSETEALGDYSHAEGFYTIASEKYSHAEGSISKASEKYSHAEGSETEASGLASHAEGSGTRASGNYSHAGGYGTRASKDYSVAMGQYNAEGYLWVASDGTYIIADYYGTGTIIVDGVTYIPYTPNGSASSEQQWQRVVFSYGIGPQAAYRYNAFMITRNMYGGGDSMALVWYKNVGNGGIAPSSGSTHNVTIYKKL